MKIVSCALSILSAMLLTAAASQASKAEGNVISPKGEALAVILDGTSVESKWPAGVHINWQTGIPDGKPVSEHGRHTHCSAFVASTAKQLGVYILRPPEHGQELLANAQSEWLPEEGVREGWHRLKDGIEAQSAANRGELVVASYHNHKDNKPGHIAIVRPSAKDLHALAADGPDVIQAATVNKNRTTVREGFAGHPSAWRNSEIEYYAHDLSLP